MSRQSVLLVVLSVLLIAFPFAYPLLRTFFRGNASLAGSQESINRPSNAVATGRNEVQASSDEDVERFSKPDLILHSDSRPAPYSSGVVEQGLKLMAYGVGAFESRFLLLPQVKGRGAVIPGTQILLAASGRDLTKWELGRSGQIDSWRVNSSDQHTVFTSASVFPEGRFVAMGSPYGPMQIVDLTDRSLVEIPAEKSLNADRIAFHPDGKRFLVVGERSPEGRLSHCAFWVDTELGQTVSVGGDDAVVEDVAVGLDGETLAIAETSSLLIYRVDGLELVCRIPLLVKPSCVVAGPDGDWIVGLDDGSISVWSQNAGDWDPEKEIKPGSRRIIDIQQVPDSERYCFLTGDEELFVWDFGTGDIQRVGHHDTAHGLATSHDGQVVTFGFRNGARVWNLDHLGNDSAPPPYSWSRVVISDDGTTVAAIGAVVHVWRLSDGKCLAAFTPRKRFVKDACLSPDGSLIAFVGGDLTAEVWSVVDGEMIAELTDSRGQDRWAPSVPQQSTCARFSADGQQLMVVEQDVLRVYDVESRQRVLELSKVAPMTGTVLISMVLAMAVDSKTGRVALASSREVVIWDPQGKEVLSRIEIRRSVDSFHPRICFSNDGKTLGVGHIGRVTIYDINERKPVSELASHWLHGCSEKGWWVSDRSGELSLWQSRIGELPRYGRSQQPPKLNLQFRTHGILESLSISDNGTVVLIDQRHSPIVLK